MDSLGDRMKHNYEGRSEAHLLRRTPVIIRVDGKAFSTFTSPLPSFHEELRNAFLFAAEETARRMQGFCLFFHQSDEVSFFLRDYQRLESAAWFDYDVQKLASVTASMMAAVFNSDFRHPHGELAFFDARAFNVPDAEVANYFLWRVRDWERNSLAMLCGDHFSHRELDGKGTVQRHEMLRASGVDWARLGDWKRYGTFGYKEYGTSRMLRHSFQARPAYDAVVELVDLSQDTEGTDE